MGRRVLVSRNALAKKPCICAWERLRQPPMKTRHLFALSLLVLCCLARAADVPGSALRVVSPDGQIVIQFSVTAQGGLLYSLTYRGQPVLLESRLGFALSNAPALDSGFKVVNTSTRSHDETWKPVAAERSEIRDHYNELVVDLQDGQQPPRQLRLTFRAYDEGAALCYTFPKQEAWKQFTVSSELTEFQFAGDHRCWSVYTAQGAYTAVPLSRIKPNCERPLTIQITNGPTIALGEARLVDFARMKFRPTLDRTNSLQAHLAGPATIATPYTTPWRFVLVGDSPGQLIERNYLLLNLNDPCALADTSWIKPGKVIREATLTTTGAKACVDFAAKMNLQYVEFDAGWYGHEYDNQADATGVHLDPQRSKGPLDLTEVIRYAQERGIGILLYVNQRALSRQLDEILPLYQKWGVKGVKYGFVNVGSQQWTAWLHEAVRKAAAYHLMVDIHDEYRPTGFSRTYPNLLTQEGIRGNEEMPPAEHNVILPFTRGLCGAGDYTICWYSPRIKTTHAHQLAASVVYFSPFQFLFWYDRPSMFQEEPETEFFKHLPTVWDETRVIQGEIGDYVTVARRRGEDWFVATMNSTKRRTLEIPLQFLEPGRKYTAWIHGDAQPGGNAPFKVANEQRTVESTTVIAADMASNGGHAMRIVPSR